MTYQNILVALDGSPLSNMAEKIILEIAEQISGVELTACHVYAAKLHFDRFEAMENGLPDKYHDEEQLENLRNTHDDLIGNGLQLISDSYEKTLIQAASPKGIMCKGISPEGKNFKEILRVVQDKHMDLTVIGGWGQGRTEGCDLGSVAERVLLYGEKTDVMLIKNNWRFKANPIVVGIDGSIFSYQALDKALELGQKTGAEVIAVAVFDPFFHSGVFKTIADVLDKEDQVKFNFTAQEKLHDEIIDKGLEKIYQDGLEKAVLYAKNKGMDIRSQILEGKVCQQIYHYANVKNAGLVVMGRHGLHYEAPSIIGSNSHQIARMFKGNVLIARTSDETITIPEIDRDLESMSWRSDAEISLNRIPEFVRKRAKWAIEEYARAKGMKEVTLETVREVQEKMGMGLAHQKSNDNTAFTKKEATTMNEDFPEAEIAVFKKTKKLAPDFHQHILKSKILGQTIETGDKILTYKVEMTQPAGKVLITERTQIKFE